MAGPTAYAWRKLAQDVKTDGGNAGDIDIRGFTGVTFAARLSALAGGTTPSVQFIIEYKLDDGTYLQVAAGVALTVPGVSVLSIGPGMSTPAVSGVIIRPKWAVVGGPATATADVYLMGETDY